MNEKPNSSPGSGKSHPLHIGRKPLKPKHLSMLENIFVRAGTVYQQFVLPGEMVNQHYY